MQAQVYHPMCILTHQSIALAIDVTQQDSSSEPPALERSAQLSYRGIGHESEGHALPSSMRLDKTLDEVAAALIKDLLNACVSRTRDKSLLLAGTATFALFRSFHEGNYGGRPRAISIVLSSSGLDKRDDQSSAKVVSPDLPNCRAATIFEHSAA